MPQVKTHSHVYDIHPNSDWARTHAACNVCGFAIGFRAILDGLKYGALTTSQVTNALREWMARATS